MKLVSSCGGVIMHNGIFLKSTEDTPFVIVRDGLITEISHKFIDMIGYTNKELLYNNIAELFKALRVGPNIDINSIDEEADYFLFSKTYEVKFINIKILNIKEESFFIFLEKANSDFNRKCPFADALCKDEHYGIGIYSMPDVTLLKANEKYVSFKDHPFNKLENCIGKHISEFATGFKGSSYEEVWNTVIKTGKACYIDEYMYPGLNRGVTYWKLSLTPIIENNKIQYCIVMTSEITDQVIYRKTVEEQTKTIRAQKERLEKMNIALKKTLEMKDEFLSVISHEFRTPLNVINAAIQAIDLLCKNELTERSQKYLGMIKLNTFRQLRLVNNLLDITRADAGQIKIYKKNIDIVFLTKAITESVHAYASHKGIDISFISSISEKIINIDDEKYERILLNLLSNAIKFTPEGKAITVKLTFKKGKIYVEVKDMGIGIPKNKLDVIFDRFGQVESSLSRQAEGTGIGLSLVKKFVEALGGSIIVKSKVGKGSTFIMQLPAEPIVEESDEKEMTELLGNRLIQTTHVEFSDIYL